MSHTVTIDIEIRDVAALRAACRRLGLSEPELKTTKLFSSEVTGYCVALPDWRYPVVCDAKNGKVQFDNYEGRWGKQRELDRLTQAYAVEKTRLEARRQGYTTTEQSLADGSLKITIHVGASA